MSTRGIEEPKSHFHQLSWAYVVSNWTKSKNRIRKNWTKSGKRNCSVFGTPLLITDNWTKVRKYRTSTPTAYILPYGELKSSELLYLEVWCNHLLYIFVPTVYFILCIRALCLSVSTQPAEQYFFFKPISLPTKCTLLIPGPLFLLSSSELLNKLSCWVPKTPEGRKRPR